MDTANSLSAATATHSQMRDETRGVQRVFMMLSLILKRLNGRLYVEFTRMADPPTTHGC